MSAAASRAEEIHPSLWRASQLARGGRRTLDTGYPALSTELPGGGWPIGVLVDLLVQTPGVGEMRLLRPALSSLGERPIALVQPPHIPDGLGLDYIGLSLDQLLQVKAPKSADAFWSAEQILRAGTCGALILWAQHAQASSLRRLHLAAQSSETLFIMVRPLASAQDSSPALLRLALRPSADGLMVDIVKRRGPTRAEPLSIPLQPTPVLFSRHARLSRRPLAEVAARSLSTEVVA
ncbi:translesion DNA synthesis-associated protein ImuA [Paraburkholderia azotifigens]|uniref:Translesion DNA synthesis-associated protein ImuA n=1 Tax=Paraburkholderia azotifigens TaxID=2057004 RepID=A0A5C6VS71_9BURK|nr:translesion DNA synthesis-associated protein ImuA [Paraburkholderia azotifigens]TXC86258.1 translesion DNA synthesis-associated protein ImuA [Paraburkholderia azotifigens]